MTSWLVLAAELLVTLPGVDAGGGGGAAAAFSFPFPPSDCLIGLRGGGGSSMDCHAPELGRGMVNVAAFATGRGGSKCIGGS